MFFSADRTRVIVKIRATYTRLQAEADRIDFPLPLDPDTTAACAAERTPTRRPIRIEDPKRMCEFEPFNPIYVRYDSAPHLQVLYRSSPPFGVFNEVSRLKLTRSIIAAPQSASPPGAALDLNQLLADGSVEAFFPLHNPSSLSRLRSRWLKCGVLPWSQPLEDEAVTGDPGIVSYFGEQFGFYFAFLGFYAASLVVPATVGVLVFIYDSIFGRTVVTTCLYGLVIAIYSAVFQRAWKRRQYHIALQHGMMDFEAREEPRAEYTGEPILSPVDGTKTVYVSRQQRCLRLSVGQGIAVLALLVVLVAVAGVFVFKVWVTHVRPIKIWGYSVGPVLAGCLNGIAILLLNTAYGHLAVFLNNMENHRTQSQYDDLLVLKTSVFQFVNSYSSLIYIAFIKGSVSLLGESARCIDNDCMGELAVQLASMFATQLVVSNMLEVVVPLYRARRKRKARATSGAVLPADTGPSFRGHRRLSTTEVQFNTAQPDVPFGEYAELATQYGLVTLFGVAFPLTGALALLNCFVEMQVDSRKLMKQRRRPVPSGSQDIGTWEYVFEAIGILSTFVNIGIVIFTSDLLDGRSDLFKVVAFLVAEHVIFAIRFLVRLVPEQSFSVKIQIGRQAFLQSKLIDGTPDEVEVLDGGTAGLSETDAQVNFTIFDDDDDEIGGMLAMSSRQSAYSSSDAKQA